MRAGVPVLLDEINFGDQAVIARLQDILLKRPGQTAFTQEADTAIEVRPGFTMLATANDASSRYRHREVLGPALRDRFEIIMRTYPDLAHNPLFDPSPSLMRLALASQIDETGRMSARIDAAAPETLVRITAIPQHLYARPRKKPSSALTKAPFQAS